MPLMCVYKFYVTSDIQLKELAPKKSFPSFMCVYDVISYVLVKFAFFLYVISIATFSHLSICIYNFISTYMVNNHYISLLPFYVMSRTTSFRVINILNIGMLSCVVNPHSYFGSAFESNMGCGIHQGGYLSLMKYTAFINPLLEKLEHSNLCCGIGNIRSAPVGYADDLATATISKHKTDKVNSLVFKFSRKWRFTFNAKKSAVLTFGESHTENEKNSKYSFSTWK